MTLDEAVDKYYAEHRGLSASMDSDYLKLIIKSILPTINVWNYGKPKPSEIDESANLNSIYLIYARHEDCDVKEYVTAGLTVFEDMCKSDSLWEIYAWQVLTPVVFPEPKPEMSEHEFEVHACE